MICPKCKHEMKIVEAVVGSFIIQPLTKNRIVCINEKCEYYGIPRFDLRDED